MPRMLYAGNLVAKASGKRPGPECTNQIALCIRPHADTHETVMSQQHVPNATLKGLGRITWGRPHGSLNKRLTTAYVYSQRSACMFVYAVPVEWRDRNLQPAFEGVNHACSAQLVLCVQLGILLACSVGVNGFKCCLTRTPGVCKQHQTVDVMQLNRGQKLLV